MTERVLMIHNRYRSAWPSGEDLAFDEERALLTERGHAVEVIEERSDDISNPLIAALAVPWSLRAASETRAKIRSFRPDVVHFHNTFPLISPSAVRAAHDEGAAVVMSLHNFRLMCAAGGLFRDGRPCEECLGRAPAPALIHGCYRGSRAATVPLVAMQASHRLAGTFDGAVDRFITPSSFAREKLVRGGLAAERVVVKPNFLLRPPPPPEQPGSSAIFLGRIDEGKGIRVLLEAWAIAARSAGGRSPVALEIAGDGPLLAEIRAHPIASSGSVRILGRRSFDECLGLLRGASFLVLPAIAPETFSLAIRDAFAMGRAVIATRLGAPAELVEEGKTGLLVPPDDAPALARAIAWAVEHPQQMDEMGKRARAELERRFTGEANYPALMEIYRGAIRSAQGRAGK